MPFFSTSQAMISLGQIAVNAPQCGSEEMLRAESPSENMVDYVHLVPCPIMELGIVRRGLKQTMLDECLT